MCVLIHGRWVALLLYPKNRFDPKMIRCGELNCKPEREIITLHPTLYIAGASPLMPAGQMPIQSTFSKWTARI